MKLGVISLKNFFKHLISILFIGFAVLIIIGTIVSYFILGNPITRNTVSVELQDYLEDKYDEKFVLIDVYYNFKDGSYGAEFEDKSGISFNAEKLHSSYSDYYVENLWTTQLEKEVDSTLKNNLPSLSIEEINYNFVYGIANDLKVDPNKIPNYKDVDSELSIMIKISGEFKNEHKAQYLKEILNTLSILKKNEIYVDFNVYFKSHNEEGKSYNINIESHQINEIDSLKKLDEYFSFY